MSLSDLKLAIFREIDTLEKERLEELYGILLNFINGSKELDEWEKLTEEQKRGILDAIDEIDSGQGIPHHELMSKIRNKHVHA